MSFRFDELLRCQKICVLMIDMIDVQEVSKYLSFWFIELSSYYKICIFSIWWSFKISENVWAFDLMSFRDTRKRVSFWFDMNFPDVRKCASFRFDDFSIYWKMCELLIYWAFKMSKNLWALKILRAFKMQENVEISYLLSFKGFRKCAGFWFDELSRCQQMCKLLSWWAFKILKSLRAFDLSRFQNLKKYASSLFDELLRC